MTKKEHIAYWTTNAERDWQRAERCFKDLDYVFCLFCLHLSVEKICKAIWVKYLEEKNPPRIHNLEKILRGTTIELTEKDLETLVNLHRFNLEGRYPDYKDSIYKECNRNLTNGMIKKVKPIKICLLKELL